MKRLLPPYKVSITANTGVWSSYVDGVWARGLAIIVADSEVEAAVFLSGVADPITGVLDRVVGFPYITVGNRLINPLLPDRTVGRDIVWGTPSLIKGLRPIGATVKGIVEVERER